MNSELLTDEYETVHPETRLGQLESTLRRESVETVIAVDDGEVVGAVLAQDMLRSRLSTDAQAKAVMGAVPKLDHGTDVREAARILIENETTVAPVVDDGELFGVVTRETLLRAVLDQLAEVDVSAVQTTDPLLVEKKTPMGDVINDLRENDLGRVPVVADGELVGVATTDDLLEFVVRGTDTAERGDRGGGEKPRLVELPVENVMSHAPKTTRPTASVRSAVETMFESGTDGLVVVDDESTEPAVGVVTKSDALGALVVEDDQPVKMEIVNPEYLRTVDRREIADRMGAITEKYQELSVIDARVTLQEHDEDHRGDSLTRCEARLFTDEDQLAGTGEGYGGADAVRTALEKLEDNLLELKGKQTEPDRREWDTEDV